MCMGRTHFLNGALVGAVTAFEALPMIGVPAGPMMATACALVVGGAALLPDLDHPNSVAAHSLGPITRGFGPRSLVGRLLAPLAWLIRLLTGRREQSYRGVPGLAHLVAWISGGHRHATHSLIGTGATFVIVSVFIQWGGSWALGAVIVLMAGLGLRGLSNSIPHDRRSHLISTALFALFALLVSYLSLFPYPLIVAPLVALGALVHLVGDALGDIGVPWLWPLHRRFGLHLIGVCESWREQWLLACPSLVLLPVAVLDAWLWVGSAVLKVAEVGEVACRVVL
jgi:membrane-bound metal-dependent hydrolase YbcI (DUF457 family)